MPRRSSTTRRQIKVQLGSEITRGLGCGADPDKGRGAALEVRERLRETFQDTDMVFVTAGLGGGTGTGAAPIVAEVAREAGALTVGVVTKPFLFEGKVRMRNAERGLDELHRVVDTVITIPNQRLLALAGKNTADEGRVRAGGRGPVQRRARDLGPDHDPRPHQPRLRRRPNHHERDGRGPDGNGNGVRRRAGHRSRARRRSRARCSKTCRSTARTAC